MLKGKWRWLAPTLCAVALLLWFLVPGGAFLAAIMVFSALLALISTKIPWSKRPWLKWPLKTFYWLIGLVVLIVATLPLWLGPTVRPIACKVVPRFTGTPIQLDKLWLNPYTGRFELGGLVVANPEGYSEPTLVSVGNLVFDLDMASVTGNCMHIEDVTVEEVFFSYVSGGEHKVENVKQIQYNLAGGKEQYEANQAKAAEKAAAEKAKAEEQPVEAQPEEKTEEKSEEKKCIVDKVRIAGVKIKYGLVSVPVPTIELHDLGNESEGMTFSEFFTTIWKKILSGASALGDGVKALGSLAGDGVMAVGEGALKAGGAAVDALGEGASAIGEGAGAAVDAIGDGASAIGEGAGAAVDAIGDGAGAAVDAIKGIFK